MTTKTKRGSERQQQHGGVINDPAASWHPLLLHEVVILALVVHANCVDVVCIEVPKNVSVCLDQKEIPEVPDGGGGGRGSVYS